MPTWYRTSRPKAQTRTQSRSWRRVAGRVVLEVGVSMAAPGSRPARLAPARQRRACRVTSRPPAGTDRGPAGTNGAAPVGRGGWNAPMPDQPRCAQRYLPWKPWVEAGLWTAMIVANFLGNSLTTLIDLHRVGAGSAAWEPVVWEGSSALVWLLVLVPGVAWFTGRFPFYWHQLWRRLALYAVASVVLCLVHVLAMVGLRELAYGAMGSDYDFGPWPRGLAYEYLKDARDFAAMVVLMEGYRVLMRRMQCDASL